MAVSTQKKVEARIRSVMKQRRKKESSLEARCVKYAKSRGLLARKMNGLGFRDWPDRLFIPVKIATARKSVWQSQVLWVEFKKPGEVPTPSQERMHKDLRSRGQRVVVIDDYDLFVDTIDDFIEGDL